MFLRRLALLGAVALMGSHLYAQTTIVSDDFEGYASSAELLAAWEPTDQVTILADNGTILTSESFSFYPVGTDANGDPFDFSEFFTSTAAEFCGGAQGGTVCGAGLPQGGDTVNRWGTPFNVAPSATENVVLTADIFDDALSANKRLTVGLRNSTTVENIIELGLYNSPIPGFNYRGILLATEGAGTGPNWINFGDELNMDQPLLEDFDTQSEVGAGFHRYQAVIGAEQIVFSLDLFADGLMNTPVDQDGTMVLQPGVGTPGVDASDTVAATTTAAGFDDLRFGIPSALPSSGGENPDAAFAAFDNITLELVQIAAPTGNADFDGDNLVAGDDFLTWQRSFPITDGTALMVDGDANGDGNVDSADLALVEGQFGTNPNAAASIAAIPEPTAALLCLTSIVCCGLAGRRR